MRVRFALLSLPFLLGCQPGSSTGILTDAERAQIADEVIAWTDDFFATMAAGDVEGNLALHDRSDLTWATGGVMMTSWQEYEPWIRRVYEGWESWEGQWLQRNVTVFNRNEAMVRAASSERVEIWICALAARPAASSEALVSRSSSTKGRG
jgi:hypothetical protein